MGYGEQCTVCGRHIDIDLSLLGPFDPAELTNLVQTGIGSESEESYKELMGWIKDKTLQYSVDPVPQTEEECQGLVGEFVHHKSKVKPEKESQKVWHPSTRNHPPRPSRPSVFVRGRRPQFSLLGPGGRCNHPLHDARAVAVC